MLHHDSLLHDVFKDSPPDERMTFRSENPFAKPDLGLDRCIDYLFHNEMVKIKCRGLFGFCKDHYSYASDHHGVYADVEVL